MISYKLLVMGNKCWKKKGFSLLELVIVFAIIALMTGALLLNRNTDKSQTEVEAAAQQLIAQIRLLQNEALSGKLFGTAPSQTPACYFRLSAVSGEDNYIISYYDCSATAPNLIETLSPIKFNSKNTVRMSSADVSFQFSAPQGTLLNTTTFPYTSLDSAKIILQSKNNVSSTDSVCICKSGKIFEQKDSAAACAC